MTPDDFTLTCVPMVGALAPLRAFVAYGCRVRVAPTPTRGAYWGKLRPAQGSERQPDPDEGIFWMDVEPGHFHSGAQVRRDHLDSVDLVTSPAARSAAVAWLASQGHADAGASDAVLLNALRAVCGLPPAPPVLPQSPDRLT